MKHLDPRRFAGATAVASVACLAALSGAPASATAPPTTDPAGSAAGAPVDQDGLANINLTGTSVQVPVALAATVCDLEVAVLVDDLSDGAAPCPASSESNAEITTPDGGPVEQDGLVNVNITDLVVQVPVSLAANVCDVTVAALVDTAEDTAAPCDAAGAAEALTVVEPPAERGTSGPGGTREPQPDGRDGAGAAGPCRQRVRRDRRRARQRARRRVGTL